VIVALKDLKEEILHRALPLVDEFTLENYRYYTSRRLPILNVVIDSIMSVEESYRYLRFLEESVVKVAVGRGFIEAGVRRPDICSVGGGRVKSG
jgi:hypothetical protein